MPDHRFDPEPQAYWDSVELAASERDGAYPFCYQCGTYTLSGDLCERCA